MKLLYFDLETTGTNFWQHGIHQISGCIEIDNVVVETFDLRVAPNPKAKVEQQALDVCSVTLEQIQAYPPMQAQFFAFSEMLAKYVNKFDKLDKFFLVGYNNASFDNQFLRAWFTQNATNEKEAQYGNYFGSWFWSNSLDVLVLAGPYLLSARPVMENFQLKTVAKQVGIEVDETRLHDAQYDIELTRAIFKLVCKI
jgi:DNA polymerase III subunit epsilon